MELHTRDAEDAVALAQLGAAAIILWHKVPRGLQADLLHVADTITGVPTVPDAPTHSRVTNKWSRSLGGRGGSDRDRGLFGRTSRSHRYAPADPGANKPWSRVGEHLVTQSK
jgi:hypothetical protein